MSSILYYITGHGYGHAVRSNQVIRRLLEASPDLQVHVRTTAPDWLFYDPLCRVSHSHQATDVGIIQEDGLAMNLAETLDQCQALHDALPRLIEQETRFVKDHRITLIAGDVPPLCFEIAARVNLPSVAIANFTWSWIYRSYAPKQPAFLPLIEAMESCYRKATLALTLPYHCDLNIFSNQEPIPWIARASALTKDEARAKFNLPKSATIVLLTFGGFGLQRLPWHKLRQLREFFFITTGDATRQKGNLLIVPNAQSRYEDLLRAVDVIVTKPGYGIVADAIAHRLPILYTDRGQFPEYPFLVRALEDLATAEFIAQEELLSGNIGGHLHRLLSKPANWPEVSLDGAAVAANRILRLSLAPSFRG